MNNFLPEGYDKIPSTGRYMKLADGKNTFRVLSSAITGWEYWNDMGKPVRLKERPSGRPLDIRTESDGRENIKHFWAFVVWNYAEKMVQILEITHKQIMAGIKNLVDDENWGNPKSYDIMISRNGSGFDTEYVTQAIPPKPLDPKIVAEYEQNPANLSALFGGGDPFATKPAAEEAIDGPGYEEPAIVQEKPSVPDRYASVPPEFRPKAPTDSTLS
jgi:hypothetical protein